MKKSDTVLENREKIFCYKRAKEKERNFSQLFSLHKFLQVLKSK